MSFDRLNQLIGRLAVASNSDTPPPRLRTSQLATRSVSSLSLIAEPSAVSELRVRNMGAALENVWIVVDYDPQALEIEALGNLPFTTLASLNRSLSNAIDNAEQALVQSLQQAKDASDEAVRVANSKLQTLKSDLLYPARPSLDVLRATTDLGSGQELIIPFQVKRLGSGGDRSKIVWKIISRDE